MSYVDIVRMESFSTLLTGNEVLFLKPAVFANNEGKNEYALAAMLMVAGEETIQVGYVSREYLQFRGLYENKLVQITKLYKDSNNKYEQLIYKRRGGMMLCKVIN